MPLRKGKYFLFMVLLPPKVRIFFICGIGGVNGADIFYLGGEEGIRGWISFFRMLF